MNKKSIRPALPETLVNKDMSEEEYFQNTIIRPIIKMQHDLFIQVFQQHFKSKKNAFFKLAEQQREKYIENIFQKNIGFRGELRGIVIGQFTAEEYKIYIHHSSKLNKRMMNILKKRILDSQSEFVKTIDG
jgi:5-methylthioribose kinase